MEPLAATSLFFNASFHKSLSVKSLSRCWFTICQKIHLPTWENRKWKRAGWQQKKARETSFKTWLTQEMACVPWVSTSTGPLIACLSLFIFPWQEFHKGINERWMHNLDIFVKGWVAGNKIVSWLRFLLSWSLFFSRDLEQNFSLQSFAIPWTWDYQT